MTGRASLVRVLAAATLVTLSACSAVPPVGVSSPGTVAGQEPALPEAYAGGVGGEDSSATVAWREFFDDEELLALVDHALAHNQELNVLLQEIEIARNEVGARRGEYLPSVDLRAGAGVDKVGRYTREGVVEESLPLDEEREKEFPEPLPDFLLSLGVQWELDVWKRLRNEKKAAVLRYLATREGRNFMVTHLVAEIASAYYELVALDERLVILEQMIDVQRDVLRAVRLQKASARATELAVRRFEAEVLKNESLRFEMRQRIVETENRINFLAGRYPQPVRRASDDFDAPATGSVSVGRPLELLELRPDVRRAELELAAAALDVRAARARFYPSLELSAGIGLRSAEGDALFTTPESLVYGLAGDLVMPLLNRAAIRAEYGNATAEQLQAVWRYRQTVLNAFVEVSSELSRVDNLAQSYDRKRQQVEALTESVTLADRLFASARAEYTEVLFTQREALESRMELVELRQRQLSA
ncbi:MAG: efflux transporter outer membrane subunit, partial [Pseudomonadales bacterium]|nr:efflux transporter outer membrane subunit [Pseudomonadales bacterium]